MGARVDRVAVFVDAGYLFAQGSVLLAGAKRPRGHVELDAEGILKFLAKFAQDQASLPLLRIYWYDGTSTGPTPAQLAIAYRPNVKMRLGFVNNAGEQKGVDSLIVTDLIALARNRAMSDAILMTGDEDIRVGVQQAQEFGVRVHLLGIEPAPKNQSGFLVQEADSVTEITKTQLASFMKLSSAGLATQPTIAPTGALPTIGAPAISPASASVEHEVELRTVAQKLASALKSEERAAILATSKGGSVPATEDRKLLLTAAQQLQVELDSPQKRVLRRAFLDACK